VAFSLSAALFGGAKGMLRVKEFGETCSVILLFLEASAALKNSLW